MKIAIYGGTFNPPHKGHTSLAKSLITQGLVDEVWLLVSPLNPFKQAQTSEFAPYDDRLKMTELAVSRIKGLRASDFENHLPRPSYMLTTLDELSKAYPQHQFVLVIGADNWQSFDRWYKYEEILAKYPILIYNRPGYDITINKSWIIRGSDRLEERLNVAVPGATEESALSEDGRDPLISQVSLPNIKIVDTPLYDISSTQLREQIREGKKPRKWLSKKVIDYIEENGLYQL